MMYFFYRDKLHLYIHDPCLFWSQDLQWYTTNNQWTVKLIKSRGKVKNVMGLTSNLSNPVFNEYDVIPLTLYPQRGSRGISRQKRHSILLCILQTYTPLTLYLRRGSSGILDIPPRLSSQHNLAVTNTADVSSGKPITVWLQYISGISK
jgi:hypothetical protein